MLKACVESGRGERTGEKCDDMVKKITVEMEERNTKRYNLIIHGLNETLGGDKKSSVIADKKRVGDIIKIINSHNEAERSNVNTSEGVSTSDAQGMPHSIKLIDQNSVVFVNRIGRNLDNNNSAVDNKKRLLKVKFRDITTAQLFMQGFISTKRTLKDNQMIKELKVVWDLTVAQRKQKQKTWEEIQTRTAAGEVNLTS